MCTSPSGQCQNEIVYTLCSQIWRSCTQAWKTRPGADCGSDHQLLTAKFRLKLKKPGENTRPAGYDLNESLYEFTVVVTTDRFKGLDLDNSVPEELWTEVYNIVQEVVNKPSQRKNKRKKAKRLSEEALQIVEEQNKVKCKGERERCIRFNA